MSLNAMAARAAARAIRPSSAPRRAGAAGPAPESSGLLATIGAYIPTEVTTAYIAAAGGIATLDPPMARSSRLWIACGVCVVAGFLTWVAAHKKALAAAADATGAAVVDFHVGPVFPADPRQPGHHRYLVEFTQEPAGLDRFAAVLDAELGRLNEDYKAHRAGDLTMKPPEVCQVRRGGFGDWLRSQGKLGGQHKVPRMDNTGRLTEEMVRWLAEHTAG